MTRARAARRSILFLCALPFSDCACLLLVVGVGFMECKGREGEGGCCCERCSQGSLLVCVCVVCCSYSFSYLMLGFVLAKDVYFFPAAFFAPLLPLHHFLSVADPRLARSTTRQGNEADVCVWGGDGGVAEEAHRARWDGGASRLLRRCLSTPS